MSSIFRSKSTFASFALAMLTFKAVMPGVSHAHDLQI